jgi:type IV secretory pathway VirB2 component (pilin)
VLGIESEQSETSYEGPKVCLNSRLLSCRQRKWLEQWQTGNDPFPTLKADVPPFSAAVQIPAYRGPSRAAGGADDRPLLHQPPVAGCLQRQAAPDSPSLSLFTLLILFPALALAQSPFDTGFTAMQTLFTGTVAKVASLIAIVVGGYQFAHGEPGAKKTLAGVAAGTGIAVLATNVLTWLWGV